MAARVTAEAARLRVDETTLLEILAPAKADLLDATGAVTLAAAGC